MVENQQAGVQMKRKEAVRTIKKSNLKYKITLISLVDVYYVSWKSGQQVTNQKSNISYPYIK